MAKQPALKTYQIWRKEIEHIQVIKIHVTNVEINTFRASGHIFNEIIDRRELEKQLSNYSVVADFSQYKAIASTFNNRVSIRG